MPKLVRQRFWYTSHGAIVFAAKEGYNLDYAVYMQCFHRQWGEDYMLRATLKEGDKIPHSWAAAIFPDMDAKLTWRP